MGSILYDGIHFKRLTAFLVLLVDAHRVEKAVLEIKDGIANCDADGADVLSVAEPKVGHDVAVGGCLLAIGRGVVVGHVGYCTPSR